MRTAEQIFKIPEILAEADAVLSDVPAEDVEATEEDGEDSVSAMVVTLSPSAAGIYQVQEAAALFDLEYPKQMIEDLGGKEAFEEVESPWAEWEWGWEEVEEAAGKLADELNELSETAGYPFNWYIGHHEHSGDYGVMVGIDIEEWKERYGGE